MFAFFNSDGKIELNSKLLKNCCKQSLKQQLHALAKIGHYKKIEKFGALMRAFITFYLFVFS